MIKRSNIIKSGLGYSFFKAKNRVTGKRLMAKVYNKKAIQDLRLKKVIEQEILVHENLKQSKNILTMTSSFESETELFIMYQNFQGFVDLKQNARNDFEQKCIFSQVVIGLMEINSFGYSVGYFDTNNLVKIGEYDYRLFDLNYLTKHRRQIKNARISQELGVKAPEIDSTGKSFRKTDVWSLGIFMLMIFQRNRILNISRRRLMQNSLREI
jgi:serine/threonine protein kinase